MTPAIMRARRADAAELTRISRAAKRHWGYPASLLRLWQRELAVTPGFIDRHPVYQAVHRGRVVGFYAISGTGRVRELEHMWVHPSHIGAGVGRALFAHLVRRLHAMAVKRLDVASDPNAERFYRRMGARRVGTVASTPTGRRLPLLRFTLRAGRRR
jgi:GNAT superfamily N-acetyltransferase